jgi:hypothetical protein
LLLKGWRQLLLLKGWRQLLLLKGWRQLLLLKSWRQLLLLKGWRQLLLLKRGISVGQRLLQSNHLVATFLPKRLKLPLQRQLLLQQI